MQVGDKWGFIDPEGTLIINPSYLKVDPFQWVLAAGITEEKIEWIDRDGRVVRSLDLPKPEATNAKEEGLHALRDCNNGDGEACFVVAHRLSQSGDPGSLDTMVKFIAMSCELGYKPACEVIEKQGGLQAASSPLEKEAEGFHWVFDGTITAVADIGKIKCDYNSHVKRSDCKITIKPKDSFRGYLKAKTYDDEGVNLGVVPVVGANVFNSGEPARVELNLSNKDGVKKVVMSR